MTPDLVSECTFECETGGPVACIVAGQTLTVASAPGRIRACDTRSRSALGDPGTAPNDCDSVVPQRVSVME